MDEHGPDVPATVVEIICYTLAHEPQRFFDEDFVNSDQRMRILEWFESEEQTPVLSAALQRIYETQLKDLPADSEEYKNLSRKIEECKERILCITDIVAISGILGIVPELTPQFSDYIQMFLGDFDPYTDYHTLGSLLEDSLLPGWSIKNKNLTALKKLATNNVTKDSKPYEILTTFLTEREIRFLNYQLFERGISGIIASKIVLSFFDCILSTVNDIPLNEREIEILRVEYHAEFPRKIDEFSSLEAYFAAPTKIHKYKPVRDNKNWEVIYEIFQYSGVLNWHYSVLKDGYLSFDILKKENESKWKVLTESHKVDMIVWKMEDIKSV